MSAGDGYKYLLKTVASADGDRPLSTPLTRYFIEEGTPPGRWLGKGVASLGKGELVVGDQVSEAQLQLLMGMGHDPITNAPLGRAFPPTKMRRNALRPESRSSITKWHASRRGQGFERALADHLRYGGLEFTVRSARSVPTSSRSTPGTGHEEVTVDAVLDTGAFTIIGPDGSTSAVASAPAQGVRLVLSWSGARWQVARIHQQSG
ncbi:relaxase domain-containing protein [Nostocoides veronense]